MDTHERKTHMKAHCTDPDINCRHCELKSPLFCFLNDEELDMVAENKLMIVYKKGETICKQGTHMSHVISVTTGLAKMYLESSEDHYSIIRIVRPTNFIGGPGIYLDQTHHYSVTALTDTSVCFIDLQTFKNLIDSNREFAHALMKELSKNILSVYNRLSLLTIKQMPGRMADTLIYLFDEVFEDTTFALDISKKDMAELSGMAKDSAVKILRDFQNRKIIGYKNSAMTLLDRDMLYRISRTG